MLQGPLRISHQIRLLSPFTPTINGAREPPRPLPIFDCFPHHWGYNRCIPLSAFAACVRAFSFFATLSSYSDLKNGINEKFVILCG